jgi:predicted amidophosphoribosyltransferase
LASALARRLHLELRPGAIRRNWATPTQTRLGVLERRRNVHGAFGVAQPEWVRGRTVLMIDDVMTTGATLSEVARCLKTAGAWRIWALAVARD